MNVEIADIKKLNLGPDDVLVVKVDGVITNETLMRLKEEFAKRLPNISIDRLLVIDRSISLQVITREAA